MNDNHVALRSQILTLVCAYVFPIVRTMLIVRTKMYQNMRTSTLFVRHCTVPGNGCTYKIFLDVSTFFHAGSFFSSEG